MPQIFGKFKALTTDAPVGKDALRLFIEPEANQVLETAKKSTKPVIAVLNGGYLNIEDFGDWRWKLIAEMHSRLSSARIPIFSTIGQAANTTSRLAEYYERTEI